VGRRTRGVVVEEKRRKLSQANLDLSNVDGHGLNSGYGLWRYAMSSYRMLGGRKWKGR
jgi:hypothetical protein